MKKGERKERKNNHIIGLWEKGRDEKWHRGTNVIVVSLLSSAGDLDRAPIFYGVERNEVRRGKEKQQLAMLEAMWRKRERVVTILCDGINTGDRGREGRGGEIPREGTGHGQFRLSTELAFKGKKSASRDIETRTTTGIEFLTRGDLNPGKFRNTVTVFF